MPKIEETADAFVVSSTFGEQVASVLPGIAQGITAGIAARQKKNADQLALQLSLTEMSFTERERALQNPAIVKAMLGNNPTDDQIQGLLGDRSPEEKLSAATGLASLNQANLQNEKFKLENEKLQMDITAAKSTLDRFETAQHVPDDELTMEILMLGNPTNTREENYDILIERTEGTEVLSKARQFQIKSGPEYDKWDERATYETCTKEFMNTSEQCVRYAQAVVRGSLEDVADLPIEMVTRGLAEFNQRDKEYSAIASRFEASQKAAIGVATNALMSQFKGRLPIDVAQDMARRLTLGIPLTPEQAQFGVDEANFQLQVGQAELTKYQIDMMNNEETATAVRQFITQGLAMYDSNLTTDPEKEKIHDSVEAARRWMTDNLAQRMGDDPVNWSKQPSNWTEVGMNGARNAVVATLGFMEAAGISSGPGAVMLIAPGIPESLVDIASSTGEVLMTHPRTAIYAQSLVAALKQTGHHVSKFLEGTFFAAEALYKLHNTGLPNPIGPVHVPTVLAPGQASHLSADQENEMSLVLREIQTLLDDNTVTDDSKRQLEAVINNAEDVIRDRRPFTDFHGR